MFSQLTIKYICVALNKRCKLSDLARRHPGNDRKSVAAQLEYLRWTIVRDEYRTLLKLLYLIDG